MDYIINFFNKTSNNLGYLLIDYSNYLIEILNEISWLSLFLYSIVLIVLHRTGKKLSQFVKPGHVKISTQIRFFASNASEAAFFLLMIFCFYLLTIFFFVFIAYILLLGFKSIGFSLLSSVLHEIWSVTDNTLIAIIGGGLFGVVISYLLNNFLIPDWESGEGLHDVDNLVDVFSKLNGYDPIPFINIKKGCFIGKDLKNNPIYVDWKKIRETHIQVIGATGSGKGVLMTLISYQTVLAGECLIWIDPKFCRFSPRILASAAKQAGKQFYFINLNPDQPAQINPFVDAEAFEIEELLVSSFDLKGKGTEGDFHRSKDEDAAIQASRLAVKNNALSILELIQVCRSIKHITDQENFWRKLCKLGDLEAIKTKRGINLREAILSCSVIYIVGSTDNERVKMLQKLLLVRINQIIKKQDRFDKHASTCIVLDEFKHVISPTSLTALGVIRDFDTHCLLAHQSLGDLDSCAGITRAEAEGAVLDNTSIKIIYRLGDSSYAEKLSKLSGKTSVFVEQSGKNLNNSEQSEGSWREMHVPLIDADVLTHLPLPSDSEGQASVGVLFGVGTAKIFHVGHIPTNGNFPQITKAEKDMPELDNKEELI